MRTTVSLALLLIPAALMATIPPGRNVVMSDQLKRQAAAIRTEYGQGYWSNRLSERRMLREQLASRGLSKTNALPTDTVYMPVLLGSYSDASPTFAPAAIQQLLFDGPNPSGTVTQFYTENSYGQLYLTGASLGWYNLPRGFNYYVHDGGTNNAGLVYGGRDFTIDVIAASDATVDYAEFIKYYDAQGRGHVPQLAVVHTGGDAAAGADNIWSHRWNIRGRLLTRKSAGSDPYFDINRVTPEGWYTTNDTTATGKQVLIDGDYAIQPEMLGNKNTGGPLIQIGVFAHEFGHIFGLPDLYDTDNTSEGLGGWCLMASGSYGGDQSHENYPSQMSAWCKEHLGWITPVVVSSYRKGQLIHEVEDYPEVYKMWTPGAPGNQYFLVENRQRVKSDLYLLNTGLLIYHVDNNQTSNTNENHYLVDLEQADGLRNLNTRSNRGDGGDPFPGLTNNRTFSGQSNPNSKDYLNAQTYVGVTGISSSAMTMKADLDVGTRPLLSLSSFSLFEGTGANGNGRVEPGEDGSVTMSLKNLNPADASGLHLRVQSMTPGVTADTSLDFSVTALATDSLSINQILHVDPAFIPHEALFNITVVTAQDTFRFADTTIVGYPPLLIVDRDTTNENIIRFYRSALDSAGLYYETFRTKTDAFAPAAIDRRTFVLLFTGRRTTGTIPDSVQQALTGFVNRGGNLFVSGQNVAENLQGTPFLANVLHARWSKNIALGRWIYGAPADILGSTISKILVSGGDGASNQGSPDEIIPDSIAHTALLHSSATGSSCAGVWYADPSAHSKMLFLGFGFEAINGASTGLTRQQTMTSILNWFAGVTDVENGPLPGLARAFSLSQNYPNPFNPTTHIGYALPGRSHVVLEVFNLLGQKVAELVNGDMDAGSHDVRFDGTGLASGVYFYRISARAIDGADTYVATKKLLLLR